jgi:hypothetical protein
LTTPPRVDNANRPRWHASPRRSHLYADGTGFRVRWSPRLAQCIRELHLGGYAEVRWSTSWCTHVDQLRRLEQLLFLPELECALPDLLPHEVGMDVSEQKLKAAREVLAAGRRLVWTDDDEVPQRGPVYDELVALAGPGRLLLIRPESNHGLTIDHMAEIQAFCGLDNGSVLPHIRNGSNVAEGEDHSPEEGLHQH